jgi:hypothetical protein
MKQEKTWTRQADGTFITDGEIEVGKVHILTKKAGKWSSPGPEYKRKAAEGIINAAIASGFVRAEAYRLTPAAGAEKLLEAKRKIFAENCGKKRSSANVS